LNPLTNFGFSTSAFLKRRKVVRTETSKNCSSESLVGKITATTALPFADLSNFSSMEIAPDVRGCASMLADKEQAWRR
jgi:hypothetical protein